MTNGPTSAVRSRVPPTHDLLVRWNALPHAIRGFLTWLGVFAGLVLLKRNALLLPASWDESWAVLPGGLWLAENNFDLVGLLDQPEWFQYGPGTYALAPITWMTGVIASLTSTTPAFLVSLHLAHMAIGAVGLREVYRFARPVWSATASALLVTVTALVPVMNAQLGFMYLETPIFAVGMLAINAGLRGDWARASLWGALATSFKGSGILPLSAVVGASLMSQGKLTALRRAILVMLPSVVVGLLPLLLDQALATPERDLGVVFYASTIQLVRMPELIIAMAFAIVFAALPDRTGQRTDSQVNVRLKTFSWLVLSFIAFYSFTIFFVIPLYVLPRYFIALVPFALFSAWEVGRRRFGSIVPTVLGLLLVGSMLTTSSGALLGDPNRISSVGLEATNQYAPRLLLTRETLEAALETGLPLYVIPNTWFRSQYPRLGYVDSVPDRIHVIDDIDLDTSPERFIIVDKALDRLPDETRQRLDDDAQFQSETVEFTRESLTSRFVTYTRVSR